MIAEATAHNLSLVKLLETPPQVIAYQQYRVSRHVCIDLSCLPRFHNSIGGPREARHSIKGRTSFNSGLLDDR